MAWSTREIADLAGTTVNTVRHYHRTGLLEEPDRTSNGYKQYEVRHLIRLLQVRRLRDLGLPLDQIEQAGTTGDTPSTALLAVDADLAASIERLQRARGQIRAIVEGRSRTDVPAGFEDVAPRLSEPERSLALIYSQLYDEGTMTDIRQLAQSEAGEADAVFDQLPSDADEGVRAELAERYAVTLARVLGECPWLTDPTRHLLKSARVTGATINESVAALLNPAQLDVLRRAMGMAQQLPPVPGAPDGRA